MDLPFNCDNSDASQSNPAWEEALNAYEKAETNLERVNIVYEYLIKTKELPELTTNCKNDVEASTLQDEANDLFAKGQYIEARTLYTLALLHANTSEIQSLAYANRSAVLFKLGYYRECIEDCDYALEHGYPEISRPTLIKRKNIALQKETRRHTLPSHDEVPVIPENRRNSTIMGASDSIEIRTDENNNTRIYATKDIEIGEILAVEEPYSHFLLRRNTISNLCYHCLNICLNPIPCDECNWTLYCDKNCRIKARDSYHAHECLIEPSVRKASAFPVRTLSLRMIFQGFHEFLQQDSNASNNECYRSDRLKEILQFKSDLERIPAIISFEFCRIIAAMYHLVSTYTDFLKEDNEHDKFKEYLSLSDTVVRLFGTNVVVKIPKQLIATARCVYPLAATFRHSCCANVHKYFYGKKLVLRSLRTLKKNEECFISFGEWYFTQEKSYRRNALRAYDFDCTCKACENDWPTVDDLPSGFFDKVKCEQLPSLVCSNFDMSFVKKILPRIRNLLKYIEEYEPSFSYSCLVLALHHCYCTLGNHIPGPTN